MVNKHGIALLCNQVDLTQNNLLELWDIFIDSFIHWLPYTNRWNIKLMLSVIIYVQVTRICFLLNKAYDILKVLLKNN